MLADNLEIRTARKIANLEKRISDLERLVSWLVGLLIDLVAVGLGVAGALFVAGEYYRMSSMFRPLPVSPPEIWDFWFSTKSVMAPTDRPMKVACSRSLPARACRRHQHFLSVAISILHVLDALALFAQL
jgi:hypothetical protein